MVFQQVVNLESKRPRFRFAAMNGSQCHQKMNDIGHGFRLGREHGSEGRNRLGMTLQIFLEIDVDQVRSEASDLLDIGILGPADSREIVHMSVWEDTEVGNSDDAGSGAEIEQRLCKRRDERDDPSRRSCEGEFMAEYIDNHSPIVGACRARRHPSRKHARGIVALCAPLRDKKEGLSGNRVA